MKKLLSLFIISLLVSSCMIPNDVNPKVEKDQMARSPQDQGGHRSDVVVMHKTKYGDDIRPSDNNKK
ncbi:MAG: hypothetical protein HOP30_17565 [Cyclobacteriaceae bacterium]|nr:hypothetical protein [Cyclobacteriaceae bacterium]